MKISVNDIEVFTLTETQKKVIQNDIDSDVFEEDMKRRLKWALLDIKYRKCFERLKEEWEQKLISRGAQSLPTDQDQFAALVFSQPDYKNRKSREEELKNIGEEQEINNV